MTKAASNSMNMPDERIHIAMDAAMEIEQLCGVIRRESKSLDDCKDFVFRGLALRLRDLSHSIMGALSDQKEPLAEIAYVVRGEGPDEVDQ